MREKFTYRRCRDHDLFDFGDEIGVASTLLRKSENEVDSEGALFKARSRQPNQIRTQANAYEKPPENDQGFYPDRIVSRHRYYRHPGGHVTACARSSQSPRAADQLHE